MINVTCAIIRNEENQILIVQRGAETEHPYKWEFPGGKLDNYETEEECIIREIREELSMEIVICGKLAAVEHDYGHKQIRLIPFICDTLDDIPFLSEHISYKWIHDLDLAAVDFSEADVSVAKSYLEQSSRQKYEEHTVEIVNSVSDAEIRDEEDIQAMVNSMIGNKGAQWVAALALENPAIFNKLFQFSFSSDKKLAFRASWILTKACDKYPEIIYPYMSQIIESLNNLDNESTLRSFLRIISLSDMKKLEDWQHGLLTDLCFNILNSGFSSIAVKAYSMEILYKLAIIYPALSNELSIAIIILMEDGSAGITSRGRAILRKLGDMPINPKQN